MRYAITRYKSHRRDEAYRIYVTDNLRIIGKNTGTYMDKRYYDMVNPKIQDNRTGEEIVADVLSRAGIEVIN